MKVIIAGKRDYYKYEAVQEAVKASGFVITEEVSGAASGVDALGEKWAKDNNVPIKRFPADWGKNGKAAGPIRNKQMADYAEALIALWDGNSKGTANMIMQARNAGLKVFVYKI